MEDLNYNNIDKIKMTIDQADIIVRDYELWDDVSCSCHCGNPPCAKCVEQPSKENYNQAIKILEA